METRTGFLRQVLDKRSRGDRPYVCFLFEDESGTQAWINLFDVDYMGGRVGAESKFDIHEWKGERLQVIIEPSDDGRYLQCTRIVPIGMIEHIREGGRPFQDARTESALRDETGGIPAVTDCPHTPLSTAQEVAIDHAVLRALEKVGLRRWVRVYDLLGRVQQHTGIVVGEEDAIASARRIWKQLCDQGSRTTVEYDKVQRRCRLMRSPKAVTKQEGGTLWE